MKTLLNLFFLTCVFLITNAQVNYDEPANAKRLKHFVNYSSGDNEYNTSGGNLSNVPKPSCWASVGVADIWFKFVSVGNFIDIKVEGNSLNNNGTLENPRIAVYLSNDNFHTYTEICNNLTIKGNEAIFINNSIEIASSYYIRVSGSNEGSFKLCFNNYMLSTYAGADCDNAAILTDASLIFSPPSFHGTGNDPNEAKNTCLDVGQTPVEKNTIWYKWTCENAGNMVFVITPENNDDDLDFVLFKLPSLDNCSNRVAIRCMASAETGATGLSFDSEDLVEYPGYSDYNVNPPIIHDNFVKYISVDAGETYALMIENFTEYPEGEPSGFTIGFGGNVEFVSPASFSVLDTVLCGTDSSVYVINTSTNATFFEWYFGDDSDKPSPFISIIKDTIAVKYQKAGLKQIILRAQSLSNPNIISTYSKFIYILESPECYPLSIKEQSVVSDILIYPNPTNDFVYINAGISTDLTVRVYDIYGRLLLDIIGTGIIELDIQDFDNGIYFVNVNGLCHKIIKSCR